MTLDQLAFFARQFSLTGYLLNTVTLTLTGELTVAQIDLAIERFGARPLPTTKKIYSYEL